MQSKENNRRAAVGRRRGMAMLAVLFVVMAIAVIAMGFIARADMSLASGQNLCRRTQTEYTALAGLEHARALLLSPDNTAPLETWQGTGLQTEAGTNVYYDLAIENPQVSGDPNSPQYLYPVRCEAYYQSGGQKRAASDINASILYTPSPEAAAVYRSMSRQ